MDCFLLKNDEDTFMKDGQGKWQGIKCDGVL